MGSELYAIMKEEERTTVQQDQSLVYLLCPAPANKAVQKLALPMQHCIGTAILKNGEELFHSVLGSAKVITPSLKMRKQI